MLLVSLLRPIYVYLRLLPPRIPRANGALNPKSPSVELPDDVLRLIVESYVESVLSKAKTIRELRKGRKEYWAALAPLAGSSKRLAMIVFRIWRMVWATCCPMTCLSHTQCRIGRALPGTRILTLGDEWGFETLDLSALKKLEDLSVDYHKLLSYTSPKFRILPGLKTFPSSLRRLEILHFHRPIGDVACLIQSSCTKLVELRLVQCSMFSNPECMWWQGNNHRHYLIGHHQSGVMNHANTLANYIKGLPHLESFHVNSYFVSPNSVFQHRTDHQRYHPRGYQDRTNPVDGITMHNALHLAAQTPVNAPPINPNIPRLASRILWAVPCPQCEHELKEQVEDAERLAASLLIANHGSLKAVSFGSFFSEARTGPSEWLAEREYKDGRLVVSTQRPISYQRRSRQWRIFECQTTHWTLLE